MAGFLTERFLRFIAVLLTISAVSFLFLHLIPGNPVEILLGEHATHRDVVELTHALRLDQPWYVQYGAYLWQAIHGNLGRSLTDNLPVSEKIATYFPATVELGIAAMVVAVIVGVPAGVIAALSHRRLLDTTMSVLALLGVSVPVFWLGWMLLLLLAYEPSKVGVNLFPLAGRISIQYDVPMRTNFLVIDTLLAANWRAFVDVLWHLVLPAVTLGTIPMSIIAKMTRAGMLEVMQTDYIRTARAKGLANAAVIFKHGLRNALVPIVTVIGLQTGFLLGGAVLTESIFAWPGVGRLAFEAISNRDYPLINGTILLFAATFVLVNFIVDILYAVLNPRIRYVT
ncbi:MAG TPA: ABC transporter permease [Candidatus Acidoferrales bacterium]|nr:ABC transporter permease [Candidatus Acidoferrales bacterium]